MVGVSGAGAMGVSSMTIKGKLDVSEIQLGFNKINSGFNSVKGQSKSFASDMMRVTQTVSGLASKLALAGVAGAGFITHLASKAPAVAPAMAKMGVEMDKISRSLGQALAPSFERVLGWMEKLSGWVDNNKGKIQETADKFLDWAQVMGEKLWPVLEKVGGWAADHPGLFTSIVAGLALTPAIIKGIEIATAFIGLLTAPATLYALALFAAAWVGKEVGEYAVGKAQVYSGMGTDPNAPTDMSGQTLMNRLPQKAWADATGGLAPWEDPTVQGSPANLQLFDDVKARAMANNGSAFGGGSISATQQDNRRNWFLQWWDTTFG